MSKLELAFVIYGQKYQQFSQMTSVWLTENPFKSFNTSALYRRRYLGGTYIDDLFHLCDKLFRKRMRWLYGDMRSYTTNERA